MVGGIWFFLAFLVGAAAAVVGAAAAAAVVVVAAAAAAEVVVAAAAAVVVAAAADVVVVAAAVAAAAAFFLGATVEAVAMGAADVVEVVASLVGLAEGWPLAFFDADIAAVFLGGAAGFVAFSVDVKTLPPSDLALAVPFGRRLGPATAFLSEAGVLTGSGYGCMRQREGPESGSHVPWTPLPDPSHHRHCPRARWELQGSA